MVPVNDRYTTFKMSIALVASSRQQSVDQTDTASVDAFGLVQRSEAQDFNADVVRVSGRRLDVFLNGTRMRRKMPRKVRGRPRLHPNRSSGRSSVGSTAVATAVFFAVVVAQRCSVQVVVAQKEGILVPEQSATEVAYVVPHQIMERPKQ